MGLLSAHVGWSMRGIAKNRPRYLLRRSRWSQQKVARMQPQLKRFPGPAEPSHAGHRCFDGQHPPACLPATPTPLLAVAALGRPPLAVFLQVNTSGEESKYGVEPAECVELASHIQQQCPNLRLAGLMTIGMPGASQWACVSVRWPAFRVWGTVGKRWMRRDTTERGQRHPDTTAAVGVASDSGLCWLLKPSS